MNKYLLILFGFGALIGFWSKSTFESTNLEPINDQKLAQQQVEKIFLRSKPEIAYQAFVKTYSKSTNQNITHNLSHWVGEYLYKQLGVMGVAICDDSFNYGCYHGFYGRAFSEVGPDLVSVAQNACERKASPASIGGCIHGIGHGVLAYYGYDGLDLTKALELCDKLKGESGQEACYNGVFMEYNTRVMQADQAITRELVVGGELDPCQSLNVVRHRKACFFEQPSWWASTMIPLEKFFGLCETIPDVSEREKCKMGVYRMSPVINSFNTQKSQDYCMKVPSANQYSCAIKSGEVLLANHSLNALSICDIMIDTEAKECRDYLVNYKCEVLGICEK